MRFVVAVAVLIVLVACTSSRAGTAGTAPASSPVASPTVSSAVPDRSTRPSPAPTTSETPANSTNAALVPLMPLDLEPAFPDLEQWKGLLGMVSPNDESDRLYFVLQPGRILVIENRRDVVSAKTFLDIRERVNDRGNEEGLLGLAFDPDFAGNGYFYVYYSAANPRRSVISRYRVDPVSPEAADPASETVIMEVAQPFSNHNGGQIAFGPDGFLYIGLGDGGGGGDRQGNGQDLSTLLGSILRIDVSVIDPSGSYGIPLDNPFVGVPDARPEVWAYGFRNPWRFSFDAETGDLWTADVGQNDYEEVDLVRPGGNYGWNVVEANHCFGRNSDCEAGSFQPPITEYGRDGGCSITGGYVYRGMRVPSLAGAYVYGDFCSGRLWALRYDGLQVVDSISLADTTLRISSFGQDGQNELYVLSIDGRILRFVPGTDN